ncbi:MULTISPECIES: hypothetical protein [Cyanophyceae]|uniref:hypothetical protein n=1 Tax=Cyanophyceae TaxID=3028117 RepID=UPI00168345C8|nr:hypothetical protein [Trichocoleus sp. FACHB-69]MBD1934971.1 hypothetical protein [Trichocoleus sp. FACHB-69]
MNLGLGYAVVVSLQEIATNCAIALFALLQAVAQEQHQVMLLIETALGASLFWGG